MFPGVADGAEHGERVEHQVGQPGQGDGGGRRGRGALVGVAVARPGGVPGRRGQQLGVDVEPGGAVLQRLERADRSAELLAGLQMRQDVVDAPAGNAGALGGQQRDGEFPGVAGSQPVDDVRWIDRVIGQFEGADVAGQVGARLGGDIASGGMQHDPDHGVVAGAGGQQQPMCRAQPERRADGSGQPRAVGRVGEPHGSDVGTRGRGRQAGGDVGQQVPAARPGLCGRGLRRGDHGRQQRSGQQAVAGTIGHAPGLDQATAGATTVIRQVHGRKTTLHQYIPHLNRRSGGQLAEHRAGSRRRGVALGQGGHGRGQRVLFVGDGDNHDRPYRAAV